MVRCSSCNQDGHNKRTCPELKNISLKLEPLEKETKLPSLKITKEKEKAKKEDENIITEKIIWDKFKIEIKPSSKNTAQNLSKQIHKDWTILSKLSEEVHEFDEYYSYSPNEWAYTPEYLVNEKKSTYDLLWSNYIDQYTNIEKCYDLYKKGEKILLYVNVTKDNISKKEDENIIIKKIIWDKFKIEIKPYSKKSAINLIEQIHKDWIILSKLSEEVHNFNEYYSCCPNEWRCTPEYLVNEKKIDYILLWNNYLEQYENIAECYDLYLKDENILLKI
jgi:hypothetical protein